MATDLALSSVLERTKLLRAKQERIAALQTENAAIHLSLAQLQHAVILASSSKFNRDASQIILARAATSVQLLKGSLYALRQEVQSECSQLCNGFKTLTTVMSTFLQNSSKSAELTKLQERYRKEKWKRKQLHNTLVELRGNIQVCCRVRPVLPSDSDGLVGQRASACINCTDEETICIWQSKTSVSGLMQEEKQYEFDRVFSPSEGQGAVFEEIKPLLTSLLDGYNVCVMAYGQTGSGKTHTMVGENGGTGPCRQPGVLPLVSEELFRLLEEKEQVDAMRFEVQVSVTEVYNEQIQDLLALEMVPAKRGAISEAGGMEVARLTTTSVSPAHLHHISPQITPISVPRPPTTVRNSSETMSLVSWGLQHRASDSTLLNAHSSRSHLIITLTITAGSSTKMATMATPSSSRKSSPLQSPVGSPPKSSLSMSASAPDLSEPAHRTFKTKLQLVDLAGSECVGASGATGSALRETQHINKSLSALSDVLKALADGKRHHIPYRNSILTHYLQDSIGGDAKLVVLLCVSPTSQHTSETHRVLRFGSQMRQVQRGPAKKHSSTKKSQLLK
ncbi:hypothetical protein EMCRGX_G034804 [Ephydatia muelleri]